MRDLLFIGVGGFVGAILHLSQDLPIVVELVDTREKLESYLEAVEPSIREGLSTLEKAQVRFYRGGG